MFHSQFGEDKWIFEHAEGLPRRGTFVEVGAFDGVCGSNTLAFEEEGWTGLLVEADPELAEKCKFGRLALTVSTAVGMAPLGTYAGWANFRRDFTDRGKSKLSEAAPMECSIIVPILRLDFLLAVLQIRQVDLLSIDTEGTELDVWESLRLSEVRPKIVIMEFWTQPNPPLPDPVIARMAADGYREIHRTEANLIFRKD